MCYSKDFNMTKFFRYFRLCEQGYELTREEPTLAPLAEDEVRVEECNPTFSRVLVSDEPENIWQTN